MKRLFKSFILLNVILSILAVCPDRPVIPTSSITNGLLITPKSEGVSNFPTSTTKFSLTLAVTPDQECRAGSNYNLLSIGLTPPGSSTQESLTVYIDCETLKLEMGGDWYSYSSPPSFLSSNFGPVAFFLMFNLDTKMIQWEIQSEAKTSSTNRKSLTISDGISFDESTTFYLCSDKLGTSPNACTISEFVLEYRVYGNGNGAMEYNHLAGTNPSHAAFYPLTDGPATSLKSYTNSETQAASGYFGDHPTNPTPGTSPTWDSSNTFVTLVPGQFLTFPLPPIAPGPATTSSSFAFAAWVRIRDFPDTHATILSTHLADGTLFGYSLRMAKSSGFLSLTFTTTLLSSSGAARPTVAFDTWQLIGFTASIRNDLIYTETNMFSETKSFALYQINNSPPFDLSTLSFLRIGGATDYSFSGDISIVRIMSPGGGVLRYTDLCSPLSNFELGAGDFAMSCSGSSKLSSADSKCYESCPSGTRSADSLCISCSFHCSECDNTECLACDENYLLYQGVCLDSCPERTYNTDLSCENCPSNCEKCEKTKCLSCDPDSFLYKGNCLDSCPDKTYLTDSACQDCPVSCKDCDNLKCLSCEKDFLFYQGSCLNSCPDATYSTGSNCESCSVDCKRCESGTKCLACETGNFLYSGSCLDSCPDKTYSKDSTCQDCQIGCQACNSAGCLNCETEFLLYKGNCIESCPDKTYSTDSTCQDCPTNCKECNDIKCLACENGYFFYQEKCLNSCPEKMYYTGSICESCPVNCKTCDEIECFGCNTNYLLYQGDCLDSCPDQTYSTGSECQSCQPHCKACENTGCLNCDSNYFLYQGDCIDSCPAKTYAQQNSCFACSDHCIECEIDGCKACNDGYQLDTEKKCVLPSSSSQSSSPTKVEAGLSGGAIAGIACGGIALTVVAGWAFYAIKLKKSLIFLKKSNTAFTYMNSNPPSPTKLPTPIQTLETETGPMIA